MGLGCETKIDETATPFSLWMCTNMTQVKYEQKSNLCEQWDLFWFVSLLLLGCVPIRLRHPLSYPGTFDWDPMLDKCGWKDTDGNGITGNDGNGNVESGDDFMGKAIIQKAKLQISHLTAVKKDIGAGLAGGSRSWATQWRWRWGGGSRWRGQGKFHENVDNGLDELPPPPRRAPRERPGRSLLSLFPGATYSPRWSLSIVMMPFHHHDAIISISNTSWTCFFTALLSAAISQPLNGDDIFYKSIPSTFPGLSPGPVSP